jgi:hypothetical protein
MKCFSKHVVQPEIHAKLLQNDMVGSRIQYMVVSSSACTRKMQGDVAAMSKQCRAVTLLVPVMEDADEVDGMVLTVALPCISVSELRSQLEPMQQGRYETFGLGGSSTWRQSRMWGEAEGRGMSIEDAA